MCDACSSLVVFKIQPGVIAVHIVLTNISLIISVEHFMKMRFTDALVLAGAAQTAALNVGPDYQYPIEGIPTPLWQNESLVD